MKEKDWIEILLLIWSNLIATIALINGWNGKKKTAKPQQPRKRKGKR